MKVGNAAKGNHFFLFFLEKLSTAKENKKAMKA
jgi:hypothetical protein